MAKKKITNTNPEELNISDYRFDDSKRKNIPPAGLAAQGLMEAAPKQRFYYDPHLPPVLRSDELGDADKLPELLEKARKQILNEEEIQLLRAALRKHEPWLEWTGKREKKWFEVDPVALNIHERVSTQAILKIAKRENVQRDLFADPELAYKEAVKFYKHDMDWANRLILGDSLQVMTSLAYRENLAGHVQTIYFDPPYGIKFRSNFQNEVSNKDVKEQDDDLTREPEMIKAYRDTWTLGIHSYLSYLRDRVVLAKTLLKEEGSIFVQISEENLHLVRVMMDEVYGAENFISQISYATTTGRTSSFLPDVGDYILWYGRNKSKTKFRTVYLEKNVISNDDEIELGDLTSQGASSSSQPFEFQGRVFYPSSQRHWSNEYPIGMNRLAASERIKQVSETQIRAIKENSTLTSKYTKRNNRWDDTQFGAFSKEKIYVVQTAIKVIERCILMTSDPGDLVLDPTCGSGTTGYVSEQWARRWITIDTSRVAVALARQRLLTAKFDHYKLKDPNKSPGSQNTFICESVSHITLKSIAQNLSLDPIFEKYNSLLDIELKIINSELKKISKDIRRTLFAKMQGKQIAESKKNITEADLRRWKLPETVFEHWEVPFDTDTEYPHSFAKAIEKYRNTWRQKMNEVNACIQANAEQVELVDKPESVRGVVRVSGPFTVEGVIPAEFNFDETSPIESPSGELETFDLATNAVSFIENIYSLLKREGVLFTDNKHKKFAGLRSYDGGGGFIHFEGEWANGDGVERKVAVSIGPQHGAVTAWQVENVIRMAYKRGFDDVVFAGFSFTAEAQATIQDDSNPKMRLHQANIRPDVQMGDLLKNTGTGQIFTVFGLPKIKLVPLKDEEFEVIMEGVTIYDPIENSIVDLKHDKVAAWFLDVDYDGRTFCVTQAFFPDRGAWKKLEKALKGVIDEDKFEALSGIISLPFPIGEHKKAAVKVIDPRGNEVMKVLSLDKTY